MIKIFIISPLFLVCTVNYRSSFSSLIKPEYELYPQLIRCASFTAWHGEHCHGCPRAKNTLNSSLSCEQACLTYCLPEATSCSSLSMIWLEDDFLGPLPIHLFTDTAVKSETALKALFWAPTWVPGFEYVPWLACLKWGGGGWPRTRISAPLPRLNYVCDTGYHLSSSALIYVLWEKKQLQKKYFTKKIYH